MTERLEEPETRETEDAVGPTPFDHFTWARKGVEFSRGSRKGMDEATAARFLSSFARLGNKTSGPEPPSVNDAGEGRQQ